MSAILLKLLNITEFSIKLQAVIRDVITWHSTYLNIGKEAVYKIHKYVVYTKMYLPFAFSDDRVWRIANQISLIYWP
jgi:hypothetical protein